MSATTLCSTVAMVEHLRTNGSLVKGHERATISTTLSLVSVDDAETVLDGLIFAIQEYDFVYVNDLYQMVGITPTFVDTKWGWNDLREAEIRRVREGWVLILPRPVPDN